MSLQSAVVVGKIYISILAFQIQEKSMTDDQRTQDLIVQTHNLSEVLTTTYFFNCLICSLLVWNLCSNFYVLYLSENALNIKLLKRIWSSLTSYIHSNT